MRKHSLIPAALLLALSAAAQAHPGHGVSGLDSGFVHPFSGLDHLLTMLAVGLWSWQIGGSARWHGPLTFMLMLAVGGALGWAGLAVPGLETGIAASVVATGMLVAFAAQPGRTAALAVIGAFAVLHGMAHGLEMPGNVSGLAYAAGFVLASGLLHAAGLLLGAGQARVRASRLLVRGAGVAISASGVALLAGWV
ncbi:HupE/UreJ family protein [Pseudogulbenkiania ferrooxidans]|uniref:HupE/UreJ protein n=1 Tax=Pseudogulbenkiania ferrooxidans 2002 TaxID=279714 RepID=B9Z470_9NEIS|nr:HupE/UreJ family protein [Pseudogulbenkiania ferrooxidans]EEG08647.1 HupE/UreJ protein [Pseudogulbenkiania ferrooxidans 2002]